MPLLFPTQSPRQRASARTHIHDHLCSSLESEAWQILKDGEVWGKSHRLPYLLDVLKESYFLFLNGDYEA